MPLQNRFERLDDFERGTFIAALLLSAGASVCLIAPVAYHRALFARRMKTQVVQAASHFAIVGLTLLALAITCAVDLVLDLVLGRTPALFIAAGWVGPASSPSATSVSRAAALRTSGQASVAPVPSVLSMPSSSSADAWNSASAWSRPSWLWLRQ